MKKFFLVACLSAAAIINAKTIDFSLEYAGDSMGATIDGDSTSLKLIGKDVIAQVVIDHTPQEAVKCNVTIKRDNDVISEPIIQVAWGQVGTLEFEQDGERLTLSVQANK